LQERESPISICSLPLSWHFNFALKFILYLPLKIKSYFHLFILLLLNHLPISNLSVFVLSFHWSCIVQTEIDWEVITTDLTKNRRHAPAVKMLGRPN